jgi:hypothetical protein
MGGRTSSSLPVTSKQLLLASSDELTAHSHAVPHPRLGQLSARPKDKGAVAALQ